MKPGGAVHSLYAGITQIRSMVSGIRPQSQPDFIEPPCMLWKLSLL